jgi:hypothetical protein
MNNKESYRNMSLFINTEGFKSSFYFIHLVTDEYLETELKLPLNFSFYF